MQPDSSKPTPNRPTPVKPVRLFIALPLPDEIRQLMAQLSSNLQKGVHFTPSRPEWSSPETMHLTLIFLGNRDPELIEPISRMMDQIAADYAPVRIEIKRLGVFPHWRNPRVLWSGIRDRSHQIEPLQNVLSRRLERFGYEPETREYHPHLTLARFKSIKGAEAVEKIVNNHQDYKFGPFDIPEMVLFKSELHPSGAIHTALHRAPFKQEAPRKVESQ